MNEYHTALHGLVGKTIQFWKLESPRMILVELREGEAARIIGRLVQGDPTELRVFASIIPFNLRHVAGASAEPLRCRVWEATTSHRHVTLVLDVAGVGSKPFFRDLPLGFAGGEDH